MDSLPVLRVIEKLPYTDCRRLSAVCRHLRCQVQGTVSAVLLCQQDLEEDWANEALSTFSHATQLHLADLSLTSDCALELTATAPQLLQRLHSLQITNPAWLEAEALLQLVSSCPSLRELAVRGPWQGGSSATLQDGRLQMPQQLQRLAMQRNSNLDQTQLLTLLSSTAGHNHHHEQQQQPLWCRALARHLCENGNSDCSSAGDALPGPTWPHLTALDLTACPKLGASLAFLAACPSLRSLCLHSCFKVTDATLQDLHKALHSSSDTGSGTSCQDCGDDSAPETHECSEGVQAGTDVQEGPASRGVPLQQLDLSYTRIRDGSMPHLAAALPNLCWLGLKGCNVGDDGLQHLLRLQQQLTALHIKHCHRVTDEGIQGLSQLSRLRSLSYGYTSMPEADDVVAAIARQFTGLTALDLLASELTDTGIAALSKLPCLQQLKLYQAGVTAEGLTLLAAQPAGAALHSLVLYGTGALRELACLGSFPALQALQLGRLCDLSQPMATALRELTHCQHLTALTLERMDDLDTQVLRHILKGCKELLLLRARGCDGVCEEDMEELAQQAAGVCSSSASVWWAAAPSCDTDDEEEGWQLLQP